ncbi:MAG: alpha/beta hydrolase [Leptolyngbyaceae cyanobacterium MO_188.B28]|nr:alpha/beta hydrolase [Leptolyngbyaceae cyanobacterium MO_188.B28]
MRRSNSLVALLAVTFTGLGMGSVLAAEEVFFRWQAASRSVQISDIEAYAVSGETSDQLQSYFDMVRHPDGLNALRPILVQDMQVDFIAFEKFLRSEAGECMLNHMGNLLKPSPRSTAGKISLRAALVNATAPDGHFSLLEILSAYPTNQLHLDVDQIARENNHDRTIHDDLAEFWDQGGLPQDQMRQLEAQFASEDISTDLPPLDFTEIDYDVLADVTLRICEKLNRSVTDTAMQ